MSIFCILVYTEALASNLQEVILILNPTGASLQTSEAAHRIGFKVFAYYDSDKVYQNRDRYFDKYIDDYFVELSPLEVVKKIRESNLKLTSIYLPNEVVFPLAQKIAELAAQSQVPLGEQVVSFLNLKNPDVYFRKSSLQYFLNRVSLQGIAFYKVEDLSLSEDFSTKGIRFPAVLKPDNSFGTKNVYIVKDVEHLKAVLSYLPKKDEGPLEEDWIVQSFQSGSLYILDFVANPYMKYVPYIWKYKMLEYGDRAPIFDYVDLVQPTEPVVDVLLDYVDAFYNGLGDSHVRLHLEIFVEQSLDHEIKVQGAIDNGFRLGGGLVPISSSAIGLDIADKELLVSSNRYEYTEEEKLDYKRYFKNSSTKYARIISIPGIKIMGNVRSREEVYAELRKLRSFFAYRALTPFGAPVPYESDNIFNLIGRVELVHEDLRVLEADHGYIENLKREAFFVESPCGKTFEN